MKRARHCRRKENEDRLGDLPDCILLHILTFMNTKDVVQTCVLSKRWKDLWKHIPALLLHSSRFRLCALFSKFVTKVLSCRDGSAALCNLNFAGCIRPQTLRRLVRYAVSHDVQQLRMRIWTYAKKDLELPLTIFSSQSLTCLKLSVFAPNCGFGSAFLVPKSLSLTALTNLSLENLAFCPSDNGQAEPFSNCKKLHTLVIEDCTVRDAKILCISNAGVANLTMSSSHLFRYKDDKLVLSTPNLRSFAFTSFHQPQKLVGSNLSFLEEVYIDVSTYGSESASILISWFQVLAHVKSMTLSSSTLRVLSFIPDLLNMQSPCFGNLNSLKVQSRRYA